MKKAVIAYLLAVLLISLIGLSVGITVADNPEAGDGGTHTQDDPLKEPELLGEIWPWPCGNWFTPGELYA